VEGTEDHNSLIADIASNFNIAKKRLRLTSYIDFVVCNTQWG
jgi:hypothetical protein